MGYLNILVYYQYRAAGKGGGDLAKFIFPRKIGKHKNFKWEEQT